MSAVAAEPRGLGLPWRTALLRAAAALWLPTLVPILLCLLRDCGHCQGSYLLSLPIVPGVLLPVLCQLDDAWFFVVGGATTLALFAGLGVLLRELPVRLGWIALGLAALLVAFEAIGFAMALRA